MLKGYGKRRRGKGDRHLNAAVMTRAALIAAFTAVGVPVFAGFRGGLGVLFGDTGGYLLAYPLAAAVAGLAARSAAGASRRRRGLIVGFLWGSGALAVIYALGATWLAVLAGLSPAAALVAGVLPFVVFDLIKVGLANLVAVAVAPAIAASRA